MQQAGPRGRAFFVMALELLRKAGPPFLVGGAYAYKRYTGLERHTRDLDVFVRPSDAEAVLQLFAEQGFETRLPFPHWLGKVYKGRTYLDVIFSSGNGIAEVDERWFEHAVEDEVLGVPVKLCAPEEMIWSKAFIMERERFDGADLHHLFQSCARELDWERLLERFGPHQLVLLSHLVNFVFVFPSESVHVPEWVWERLLADLGEQRGRADAAGPVCRGTLLSRTQYLTDLERGFRDARLPPDGPLRPDHLAVWTEAAVEESDRTGVPNSAIAQSVEKLRE